VALDLQSTVMGPTPSYSSWVTTLGLTLFILSCLCHQAALLVPVQKPGK